MKSSSNLPYLSGFFTELLYRFEQNTRYSIRIRNRHNTIFEAAVNMHIFIDIYNTYIYVFFST